MILTLVILGYMNIKDRIKLKSSVAYPLSPADDRLEILKSIRGMWKHRKPDPIKELNKMRREWERKLI